MGREIHVAFVTYLFTIMIRFISAPNHRVTEKASPPKQPADTDLAKKKNIRKSKGIKVKYGT